MTLSVGLTAVAGSMSVNPNKAVADGNAESPSLWLTADGEPPPPFPWLTADGEPPPPFPPTTADYQKTPWLIADGQLPPPPGLWLVQSA